MSIKIEAGRDYVLRSGSVVRMKRHEDGFFTCGKWHYSEVGECCYRGKSGSDTRPMRDVVAVAGEEPEHTEVDLRDIADQPQDASPPPEYVGKDELIRGLVEALTLMVRWHRTRARKTDDLLPADKQEPEVAKAMALIARAEGR